MNTLRRLNAWLSHRMTLLIVVAMVLGLSFPSQVSVLCRYVTAMMVFQTFANSLGGGARDLAHVLSHPKPVLLTLFALHVLMPLIALGLGTLCFPNDPIYALGMVLEESAPAAVSSLMWVVIGGGSAELCLSIVLLDTLLSPIVFPLTLRLLCGSVVELDTVGMIQDLIIMIVIPAVAAMVLHRIIGKDACTRLKGDLSIFAKLCLMLIVAANVTRCIPFLQKMDSALLLLTFLTVVMRVIGLFIGWLLARACRFRYAESLTVTINSSMRNNAAASTLAAQYFPAEAVFSPSISPLFMQFAVSIAVHLYQKKQAKER